MVSRKRDHPEDSDGDDSNVSDNEDSASESHEVRIITLSNKRSESDSGV